MWITHRRLGQSLLNIFPMEFSYQPFANRFKRSKLYSDFEVEGEVTLGMRLFAIRTTYLPQQGIALSNFALLLMLELLFANVVSFEVGRVFGFYGFCLCIF